MAVDRQRLDLVEDGRVLRARRVAPVSAPGHGDVDRRLTRLHDADLPRRRVRAQQRVVVDVERVARRPRGVRQRLVERVEVVPDRLHLAAVHDLVAEAEEDVLDLAHDLRQRMEMPERRPLPRQRDVEALGGLEPAGPLECGVTLVDRSLEALAHGVQRHAGLAVANLPQRELQLALAAEEPDAQHRRARRGSRPPRSRSEPRSRAPGHPSADCTIGLRDLPVRPFRRRLRRVGVRHDGGRAVLRGARAGRRRTGRSSSSPSATAVSRFLSRWRRAARDRHRLLAGDARAGACAGRADRRRPRPPRGRHARLRARRAGGARLLPVSRRSSTCPRGTTSGASSSAWRRASGREDASPGMRSASTTRSPRGSTGRPSPGRSGSAHDPSTFPADNRVDIERDVRAGARSRSGG